MRDVRKLLQQAARLRTLLAIGRARLQTRAVTSSSFQPENQGMNAVSYPEPAPNSQARAIAADLLQRVALDASGAPFDDDDPTTWDEADAATPEIVSLGQLKFKIVDADAMDLAIAVGAIEPDAQLLCLRAQFEATDGAPALGQVVVVPTDEPAVKLTFGIWATYDDLHSPEAPDLGPDATRNPALDVLAPNQALLVQVLDAGDAP